MSLDEKTIGEIGEFALIERLSNILGSSNAVVGIGDDTAVIDHPGGDYTLATVDMLVAGVHFHAEVDGEAVGRHAMAVNISDVAAMGGTPEHALISLALPPTTPTSFIEALYRGLRQEAESVDVTIVGGNIARTSGELAVDVTLLGRVRKDEVVIRRGAIPGDILVVTGTLGVTAADRLRSMRTNTNWAWAVQPRLAMGQALASEHLAHAMIDLSDGLGSDIHHLCDASDVGAVIYNESLPISIRLRTVCRELDLDPHDLALTGGEDYELLVAMAETDLERARDLSGEVPLSVVGTVLAPEQGVTVERMGGRRVPLNRAGWRHF